MVIKRHRKAAGTPWEFVYYSRKTWTKRTPVFETRSLTRRQQLVNKERSADEIFKLDLVIWNVCPDYHTWRKPVLNKFGTIISPLTENLGSFEGKRYFRGTLPNHYLWSETGVRASLRTTIGDFYYFQLVEDNHKEERLKQKSLFDWYYKGRPGRKLRAPLQSFHNHQLVAAKFDKGDYRRCRLLNDGITDPVVVDLDSGDYLPATHRKLFAMDEQFLNIPFNAIATLIANEDTIITEQSILENWEVFLGTDTLKNVTSKILHYLLKWEFPVYLRNVKISRNHIETFFVDVSLGEDTTETLCYVKELLLRQIKTRNENIQDCSSDSIGVTYISKSGTVWLCTDIKLFQSYQIYLNDPKRKASLRHQKIIAAMKYKLPSSFVWFKVLVSIPNVVFLVVDDYDKNIYRATVINYSLDPEWYEVLYIDSGAIKRLHSINDFWSPMPHQDLPDYVCMMPPLSTHYHLHGVRSLIHPWKIKYLLFGQKLTVKIEDADRTESVQELYSTRKKNVPSISIKMVSDEGNVIDVNSKALEHTEQMKSYGDRNVNRNGYNNGFKRPFTRPNLENDNHLESEHGNPSTDRHYYGL